MQVLGVSTRNDSLRFVTPRENEVGRGAAVKLLMIVMRSLVVVAAAVVVVCDLFFACPHPSLSTWFSASFAGNHELCERFNLLGALSKVFSTLSFFTCAGQRLANIFTGEKVLFFLCKARNFRQNSLKTMSSTIRRRASPDRRSHLLAIPPTYHPIASITCSPRCHHAIRKQALPNFSSQLVSVT